MKISPQPHYYTQASIGFARSVILTRGYKKHGEKYITLFNILFTT